MEEQLNLYLVERHDDDTNKVWDIYEGFVVCCATEKEARETHPEGDEFPWDASKWVPVKDIGLLSVSHLGKSEPDRKKGVVLADYRAG